MPQVLIPSDQRDWAVHFAEAYRRLGYDVLTGTFNFDLEACNPDILHLLWPEELTAWKAPSSEQISAIKARLARWRRRSRVIFTLSNLYPHGYHGNQEYHRLYSTFFEHADVIHHFSETSRTLVCKEYPTIAHKNHIVRVGYNYDLLLPLGNCDRVASRHSFGFNDSHTVFLVFGALRFWDEVQLLQRAFSMARIPGKRLLLAARYSGQGASWYQRWRRWRWRRWSNSRGMVSFGSYIPDEEICRFFGAADVVLVVRESTLSSGIPNLAMTFGKMVIGPDVGGVPEFIEGSGNILYDPTSAASLARAMEQSTSADRETIGRKNREIAAGRDWEQIIRACVGALLRDAVPAEADLKYPSVWQR